MKYIYTVSIYPYILVELKSKTIADKMLGGMVKICDQELHNWLGQPQVYNYVFYTAYIYMYM